MNVIYVGNAIDKNKKYYKKGISIAGNKMQVGIIKGLYKYLGNSVKSITVYPIAAYPKEKDIFIKKNNIDITDKINSLQIPFINIPIIKQITQVIGVYRGLNKFIKENISEDNKILCFNAFPHTALATIAISKIYKIESICILADLPIEVVKRNFIGRCLRILDTRLTKWCILKFDKIVALNEQAIKIYADNKPYIVVDGGFDIEDIEDIEVDNNIYNKKYDNEKVVMLYSGSLIDYNGIVNLIEGIKMSKSKNYILEIYGDGPLREYVENESLQDDRIKFMGYISNNEIMKRQCEVDFLINPRPTKDLLSRVTFPSKIIEYMLSGTPLITTKLNGLTKDYSDYVNYFENDDVQSISKTIDSIIAKDYRELKKKAICGKKFIINNKNWESQCEKIYEFIK